MEKTLDVIVPLYNEKDCVEELLTRLFKLREDFKAESVDTRFIFVNDGSSDCSPEIVANYAKDNDFVKLINFSSEKEVVPGDIIKVKVLEGKTWSLDGEAI